MLFEFDLNIYKIHEIRMESVEVNPETRSEPNFSGQDRAFNLKPIGDKWTHSNFLYMSQLNSQCLSLYSQNIPYFEQDLGSPPRVNL